MPAGYSFMPAADAILHGSFQKKQGREKATGISRKTAIVDNKCLYLQL
jgi:hypothetical protein